MKKMALAALLVLILALPAFAVFSPKGQIPNGDPIEYRGLKITSNGVNIIIINRGDKTIKFSAACTFIGEKREEIGDIFVEELILQPKEQKQLNRIYLKGELKLAKKAESLRWTIYTLAEE